MQTRKGEKMFGNKILNAYSPGGHRQGLIYVGAPSGNYIDRGGLVLLDRRRQSAHDGVNGQCVKLILDRNNGNYIKITNIEYLPIDGVTLSGDWYPICFLDTSASININGKVITPRDFPIINDPKIKSTKEYVKLYADDGTYVERFYYILFLNISSYPTVILTDRWGDQHNYIYATDTPTFDIPVDSRKFEIFADKTTPITYEMNSKMFYDEYYNSTNRKYNTLNNNVICEKEIDTASLDVKFKYNTELSVLGYPSTIKNNKTGVFHIETEDSYLLSAPTYQSQLNKMFLFIPGNLIGVDNEDLITSDYVPYTDYITYGANEWSQIYFYSKMYDQTFYAGDATLFKRVQGSLFDIVRTANNRVYEGPQLVMSNLSFSAAITEVFAIDMPYYPSYPYSRVIPPTHWALYNGEVHTI